MACVPGDFEADVDEEVGDERGPGNTEAGADGGE